MQTAGTVVWPSMGMVQCAATQIDRVLCFVARQSTLYKELLFRRARGQLGALSHAE